MRTERTSDTNLRASSTGSSSSSAVSEGSLNQDLIGMALSGYDLSSSDSLYYRLVTAYL